jgi:PAS domain S-box-containing protein
LQRGYLSCIALPLKDEKGTVFGALTIYSAELNAFNPDEIRLLEELAGDLAFGITVLRARNERTRVDEALRESEEKFAAAFHAAPNLIAITRIADGTIVDLNEGYSKLLGYTRAESIGKTTAELSIWANPADRATLTGRLEQFGEITDFETTLRRKDGTVLAVLDSARTIKLQGETCILSAIHDITELKQAEDELQKLNQELERRVDLRTAELELANKELEVFAYSVSHDLRAPLRSIDGFSKILEEDYGDKLDENAKESLATIRAASQRMALLIDDILQLSRITRTPLRLLPVDLSALAASVAGDLKRVEPDRRVEFVIEPGCVAFADGNLLRIVLENLIGNAWKFTVKQSPAKIEFGRAAHEGGAEFFVRDNGVGFDMQYASKLFGAFQRLHSTAEFPGTGIGLASVQRIIHRHGGSVRIEGVPNGGATAYFTIQQPESIT